METNNILVRPIITEHAADIAERHNQISFEVMRSANKYQIKDAVESVYGVKVDKVHTSIYQGKLKRRGSSIGRKPNWKKAIVTLQKGDVIDFFATE